ncbi:MAG: 30S ribosome-binding factor RbfA [Candidatus Delongbacteria bacterium]|nr:30S ribosome-binding factor RbfA [Candidatus Delongbacteria bacterium]MCG2761118.1 30S ribosome-binding factor RbfA [Candidatus Delongbacteria bacterium]
MTGSKRLNRISSELKKTISKIIFYDLNVEELKLASINHVKMSPDLSVASVYFTAIKTEKNGIEEIDRLFRLNNKSIRMKIPKYLSLRIVPEIRFFYDDTLDNVYKIEELLNSIKKDNDD